MPNFTDWATLTGIILLIAFLVETIVEIIKQQVPKVMTEQSTMLISTLLGVILSILFQVGLFDTTEPGLKWVGLVIVGLVASRGSNYVHNWMDKLPRTK